VSKMSQRAALRWLRQQIRNDSPEDCPALDGEESAEDDGSEEEHEELSPEAAEHIERCQKVRRLLRRRRKRTLLEQDVRLAVANETKGLVEMVCAAARKVAHRLGSERFDESGYDEGVIAMLLLSVALPRLHPFEAFAPKRRRQQVVGTRLAKR